MGASGTHQPLLVTLSIRCAKASCPLRPLPKAVRFALLVAATCGKGSRPQKLSHLYQMQEQIVFNRLQSVCLTNYPGIGPACELRDANCHYLLVMQ